MMLLIQKSISMEQLVAVSVLPVLPSFQIAFFVFFRHIFQIYF